MPINRDGIGMHPSSRGLKGSPAIKHSFAVVLAPASAVRWSATAYSVGVGGTFDPAAFEGAGVNEAHRLVGS
jgi:hypothetical protein